MARPLLAQPPSQHQSPTPQPISRPLSFLDTASPTSSPQVSPPSSDDQRLHLVAHDPIYGLPILPRVSPTTAAAPPKPLDGNDLRRASYNKKREECIAWLDQAWKGPEWLPRDVREGLGQFGLCEPAVDVVKALKAITNLAHTRNIILDSLWSEEGVLRKAVSQDLENRQRKAHKTGSKPFKPHLSAAIAKAVLNSLNQSDFIGQTPRLQSPSLLDNSDAYAPLIEQDALDLADDDLIPTTTDEASSAMPSEPQPQSTVPVAVASVAPVAFVDLGATTATTMEIDENNISSSTNKRRLSTTERPSTAQSAKKQRTTNFDAAEQILKSLTSPFPMHNDVVAILTDVFLAKVRSHCLSEQPPIQIIAPLDATSMATSPAPHINSITGIFISTAHPPLWNFAVLIPRHEGLELHLHDFQPRPDGERIKQIVDQFQTWLAFSNYTGKLVHTQRTCPPVKADWASGLHALACLDRTLQNAECTGATDVSPEQLQKMYLDILLTIDPTIIPTNHTQLINELRFKKLEQELESASVDEVSRQCKEAVTALNSAMVTKRTQEDALANLIAHHKSKIEQSDRNIQAHKQQIDLLDRVHAAKVTVNEEQAAARRREEAEEKVRKIQEQLAAANSELGMREAEHLEAKNKRQVQTGRGSDWGVHLEGVKDL